jgi:hypothetical protein
MKLTTTFILSIVLTLILASSGSAQPAMQWHYPGYLANLGYWHRRIAVEIDNPSDRDFRGETVLFKTGKNEGQLDIAGTDAGALRIVDQDGIELLGRITSADKKIITEGPVPENSTVLLPVTVKPGQKTTIFIYTDNPAAWPAGSFLEGDPSLSTRRKHSEILIRENPFKIRIQPAEILNLNVKRPESQWTDDLSWKVRIPLKIFNFSPEAASDLPVYIKTGQVFNRLRYMGLDPNLLKMATNESQEFSGFSNSILMENHSAARTEKTVYAYFCSAGAAGNHSIEQHNWFNDKRNLIKQAIGEANETEAGINWRRDIDIVPGRSYMFGALISSKDHRSVVSLTVRVLDKDGKDINVGAGSNNADTTAEWTTVTGIFRAPGNSAKVRMRFAIDSSETIKVKNLIMMEVLEGYSNSIFIEQRGSAKLNELSVWPVNSIRKVFREDLPPGKIPFASIRAARNETEPLQIAVRSPFRYENVRIEVDAPSNSSGQKIGALSASIVGYVPIDYPSNYYERKVPYWYLKYPDENGGSDGWAGYWPDPLLPLKSFTLEPYQTQPIWIEAYIPEGTSGGLYSGKIRLYTGSNLLKEIPWTITVSDFSLPANNSFGALYDYRSGGDMPEPGPQQFRKDITGDSLRNMYISFMADHKVCTGEINPAPKIVYKNGKAEIDFTTYDKAADHYFNVLRNPIAYLPVSTFYLFGWAFPPSEKFGEKPYAGDYPYDKADRRQLRPEYKKAYQQVLKTFWDHLREKGWADHYVLYLSDEPHSDENGKADIVGQMRALCDMIHEVDRKIPVYVSTWWYRPEWKGYIDIWGLGFNGDGDYGHGVTENDLKTIVESGGRIWYTTDGNFCTETPYLALERMLPWFGFRYGAQAYEFWGANWLTFNPFKYGWHNYIYESQSPGEESWKRYPNGDGYIIYPGTPIGLDGLIASIRIKQVREGAEDYEYLEKLKGLIAKADQGKPAVIKAKMVLQKAYGLVNIPCSMGRYSTKILPDPDEIFTIREMVAECIEELGQK